MAEAFQRLLLAIDASPGHAPVVAQGLALARAQHAAVHLLAVGGSELRLATAEAYVPRAVYREVDAALRQCLAEAARQLRRAGLRPRIELAQGEASAAIIASARRIDADLIVLGHRQRSLFERLFDPSVAQHVLDRTRCSVLIARAG